MKEIMTMAELPEKCLFFGYGSLMYYHGINGRGLLHKYKSNKELTPVTIKGIKRSMSAEVVVNTWGDKARFYSVDRNKKAKTFGMLFKVHDAHDISALLYNEGARPAHQFGHYHLFDITGSVDVDTKGLKVFTLFCQEKKDDPKTYYPGYVKRVFKGIPHKHRKAFLDTDGLNPNEVDHLCNYGFG